MSGPYDQQALAQVSGFSAASNKTTTVTKNRQRVQPGGESSTSLSSDGSGKGPRGVAGAVTGVISNAHGHSQQQFINGGGYQAGQFAHSGGSIGSAVSGQRRAGRFHRETVQLPDICGQVRQVRRRELTPEPDTIERVYVQRAGPEIIEEITEIPTTPPPIVRERNVVEPAGPPQVVKRVIRVPPRSGGAAVGGGFGGGFQAGGNLLSAGSYGNVQHAGAVAGYGGGAAASYGGGAASYGGGASAGYAGGAASYGGAVGGGYGATQAAGGFGSYGGGQQSFGGFGGQQSFGGFGGQQSFGGFGAAHTSQPVLPPVGVHPAFCFQV